MAKKVLVTGGSGYIGQHLCKMLMDRGYEVTNIDTEFYDGVLHHGLDRKPFTIVKDHRDITLEDLEGFDAIIPLSELSNDPLGDLVGPLTREINHNANSRLAKLAKEAGIPRHIFMSSTSVYGVAESWVDETSSTNPQTEYAKCKLLTEESLWKLADDGFHPVALRNATAMGAGLESQRLDIVLPNLSALAFTSGKIAMTSDGSPWRPLSHVIDTCEAVLLALEAPVEKIHSQVFNIVPMDEHGNSLNYRVREIAEIVAGVFPGCDLSFGDAGIGADNRSYRVKGDKIREVLGYRATHTPEFAAQEMKNIFEKVAFTEDRRTGREFIRLNQIKWLMETNQVNEKLFWN